jgi:hypothetical protein
MICDRGATSVVLDLQRIAAFDLGAVVCATMPGITETTMIRVPG